MYHRANRRRDRRGNPSIRQPVLTPEQQALAENRYNYFIHVLGPMFEYYDQEFEPCDFMDDPYESSENYNLRIQYDDSRNWIPEQRPPPPPPRPPPTASLVDGHYQPHMSGFDNDLIFTRIIERANHRRSDRSQHMEQQLTPDGIRQMQETYLFLQNHLGPMFGWQNVPDYTGLSLELHDFRDDPYESDEDYNRRIEQERPPRVELEPGWEPPSVRAHRQRLEHDLSFGNVPLRIADDDIHNNDNDIEHLVPGAPYHNTEDHIISRAQMLANMAAGFTPNGDEYTPGFGPDWPGIKPMTWEERIEYNRIHHPGYPDWPYVLTRRSRPPRIPKYDLIEEVRRQEDEAYERTREEWRRFHEWWEREGMHKQREREQVALYEQWLRELPPAERDRELERRRIEQNPINWTTVPQRSLLFLASPHIVRTPIPTLHEPTRKIGVTFSAFDPYLAELMCIQYNRDMFISIFEVTEEIFVSDGRNAFTRNFTGIYANRDWQAVPAEDNISHIDETVVPDLEAIRPADHRYAEVFLTSQTLSCIRFVDSYRFTLREAERKYDQPDWPTLIEAARQQMNRDDEDS
jgi:hypothetical protein